MSKQSKLFKENSYTSPYTKDQIKEKKWNTNKESDE